MAGKVQILIVDDDAGSRATMEALLLLEGYDLAFAGSGPEALAVAPELVPDLILLDVMMPEMDGFEVCRRLRANPLLAVVPVIMVTALDDRESRLQGIESGVDDFVSKPFDSVELRARVRTVTQLNRYRRLIEEQNRRLKAEDEIRRLYRELQRYAEGLEETVAQRTRELQAERDRTQAILESLGEAVIVADISGAIQYVNPAAIALTGYAEQEVMGHNVRVWQSDGGSDDLYAPMWEAIRAGRAWRGEVVNRRRDGTLYDAMLTVAPLPDPHDPGQYVGFVSIQRDITPLKEAERLKDQFVSNVSHELRTPLSVLVLTSGNLDMLYDRLDDARRRRLIQNLREQARVLNKLVGNVLEVSRIDARHITRAPEGLNLAKVVRSEAEKQLPLAQKRSQELCVTGDELLSVWGNDGQLRQVIRNLLNNAIKYTPEQGRIACQYRVLDGKVQEAEWPGSAELGDGRPYASWITALALARITCRICSSVSIGSRQSGT